MKNDNPIKGTVLISREEFSNNLKRFGLEFDFDMICKYTDTYPQNQICYTYKFPKVFTIDFKDNTGHGWANIYSDFYKNHTTKKTELFKEFKEFIDTHTFKYKGYFLI